MFKHFTFKNCKTIKKKNIQTFLERNEFLKKHLSQKLHRTTQTVQIINHLTKVKKQIRTKVSFLLFLQNNFESRYIKWGSIKSLYFSTSIGSFQEVFRISVIQFKIHKFRILKREERERIFPQHVSIEQGKKLRTNSLLMESQYIERLEKGYIIRIIFWQKEMSQNVSKSVVKKIPNLNDGKWKGKFSGEFKNKIRIDIGANFVWSD